MEFFCCQTQVCHMTKLRGFCMVLFCQRSTLPMVFAFITGHCDSGLGMGRYHIFADTPILAFADTAGISFPGGSQAGNLIGSVLGLISANDIPAKIQYRHIFISNIITSHILVHVGYRKNVCGKLSWFIDDMPCVDDQCTLKNIQMENNCLIQTFWPLH